jgi:hypothetical protein
MSKTSSSVATGKRGELLARITWTNSLIRGFRLRSTDGRFRIAPVRGEPGAFRLFDGGKEVSDEGGNSLEVCKVLALDALVREQHPKRR